MARRAHKRKVLHARFKIPPRPPFARSGMVHRGDVDQLRSRRNACGQSAIHRPARRLFTPDRRDGFDRAFEKNSREDLPMDVLPLDRR